MTFTAFLGVLRSLEEDIIHDLYLTYFSELIYLDISRGCHRQATMKRRQDKQFYWIQLIRLEINTEKSLAYERANSWAKTVVPLFACF